MARIQSFLAVAVAFSLAGSSGSANPEALGFVVHAEHARLGSQSLSEGTTVYAGDQLFTEAEGSLQLTVGEDTLSLTERSSAILHNVSVGNANEFSVELIVGSLVLSEKAGRAGEIVANTARVRPVTETRGVVQVWLVGPSELIILARRGPAQVSYRGESEIIAEGKAYRVLLSPAEDGTSDDHSPAQTRNRRRTLILVAVAAGAAAGITAPLVLGTKSANTKGMESPDRP